MGEEVLGEAHWVVVRVGGYRNTPGRSGELVEQIDGVRGQCTPMKRPHSLAEIYPLGWEA